MLFRERSALAGMIGTSPQSISRNSSRRLMSKSPRYGRYWSETNRIILGARLEPDRYTVAWSNGTPRKTALAPSFWMAWVSHGTHGDLRNVPSPLCSNPPWLVLLAPAVNMSGCVGMRSSLLCAATSARPSGGDPALYDPEREVSSTVQALRADAIMRGDPPRH